MQTLKLLLVLALLPVLCRGAVAAQQGADRPPNILLVLSDDHSAHLGCYGTPVIRTPNFDRFAAEGMRFDRAFTAAPQCVPSRAALLSGRSAVAARITRFSSPLPPDVITLPELLREKGYYTGICRRSFHLDGPGGDRAAGVTAEVLERHGLRTFDKRVDYLNRNSPRAQTAAQMNTFFDRVGEKPFFLWISFNDPHRPYDRNAIPQPHDPAKVVLPPYLPDLPAVRSDLALYYDEIARADDELNTVLTTLKQRGYAENTIVVFMGDNGYSLPRGKGSLHDPGLNVPLLVRWPGKVKPGSSTAELVSGEDLTPTLLEAAGARTPKEMSGKSFLKLLRGEPFQGRKYVFAERGPHGQATFTEHTPSNAFDLSRCVRSSRYKLIYNCSPHQVYAPVDCAGLPIWKEIQQAHQEGKLAPELSRIYFTSPRPIYELYDLQEDPGELNNLAGKPEHRAVERELKVALQEKMILDYDFLPLPLQR